MKRNRTFLLALALLVESIQQGQGRAASRNETQGGNVSLRQWAGQNDFKPVADGKDEWLEFTSASATLAFKTNSPLAEINGVRVWLCDPIILLAGEPCISSLDWRETIEPILVPQPAKVPATVCLDPGHGGKDTGGVFGQFVEKQYTLPLARELAGQLSAAGFRAMLTRTNDTFVELEERPSFANRKKAGLFISLHFNIGAPGEAKGVEVYCLTPAKCTSTNAKGRIANTSPLPGNRQDAQNVLLAFELQKALVKHLGAEDRGLRRARFEVLRSAKMPAVLIEGGFLSDSDERKKIAGPKYRRELAAAIVQGVLAYQRAVNPHASAT